MVVDDEPQLVRVLRGYLEQAGYRVTAAHSGSEALAQFQARRPDLVVLDLNLPGMDGFEVARAIRKLGDTPIIMLTAGVEETDRLIGLELGADDYVPKPFSPREVVARVRAVLRRSRAPREVHDPGWQPAGGSAGRQVLASLRPPRLRGPSRNHNRD